MSATHTNPRAEPDRTPNKIWWLLILFFVVRAPAAYSAGQYSIQFRDQLQITRDLKLAGARRSAVVRFTCESAWKPAAGSVLHLFLSHSPNLDGGRSFLSVTLNYGILRSLRLDEQNQSTTEVIVSLPPDMLRPDNELMFSVEQFPQAGAAEPWTAVKPESFVSIQYEDNHPTLDLQQLPAPLVDRRSYRPQQLSVLLPDRPSSQTLEATAQLIANYSAQIDDALTVHAVRSIETSNGPLLVVGTPREQSLASLDNLLPLVIFRSGQVGSKNTGPFSATEGVVALTQKPGRMFSPVLVVTGNSPDAVAKAARKLVAREWDGSS